MSGDLPVFRFLEKLHAFSKEWSQCRVTCPFYDFRKTPRFYDFSATLVRILLAAEFSSDIQT